MLYLYIPLCFYYILLPAGVVYTTYVTLHSTMLLLYLDSYCRFRLPSVLYIPLCFYYISTLPPAVTNNATFTFHYASTISMVYGDIFHDSYTLHSTMLLLYLGSCCRFRRPSVLYIPLCFYYIRYTAFWTSVPDYPLHSTMLLLYPLATVVLIVLVTIFTFHYASTISMA